MSDKNFLNPKDNDLIPSDDPDDFMDDELKDLMKSDLFPDDNGPTPPPNDLCPDYVEPAKRVCHRVQVNLGGGIIAKSCPSGGLSIFKDDVQVHWANDLSAEDKKIINDYRERFK